jgi:hypothetical protein
MKEFYKTIIIGGGIAGLSCARRLNELGEDFLLITKDIGGRIKASTDGKVNYGALWAGSTYKYMNRYLKLGRRISKSRVCYYIDGKKIPILSVVFKFPWQFLKALLLTFRFYFHYRKFQKNSETMGQKQAIESDLYLRKLWFQSAEDYLKEHGIADFGHTVIEPIFYGIMVSRLREQTAFQYQLMSISMIVRGYEFMFDVKKFIQRFKDKIVTDEVLSVEKESEFYILHTASGKTVQVQNVIIATPSAVAQKLINLPAINHGRDVYVFHLKGRIKEEFKTGIHKVFGYTIPLFGIAEEADSSYVAYSLKKNIGLDEWFTEWNIIATTEWHPIYNNVGGVLLDASCDKGLWLIGDHNIIGMEDAFISGLYVANEIIKS